MTRPATVTGWAADLAGDPAAARGARLLTTSSGAVVVLLPEVVVKVHEPGTDPAALAARLAVAAALPDVLVAPRGTLPVPVPDTVLPGGRLASCWARADVLDIGTPTAPWAAAAATLARLHTATAPPGVAVPPHGAAARLAGAVRRLDADGGPAARTVRGTGAALLRALADPAVTRPEPRHRLVHGDWHLGQLGRTDGGWLLLDVDDLGLGDPAWDLGRPAGFWAAGLLDDRHWEAFLAGYRAAGGPAVPPAGDPWAGLDLPARAEVVVAAARAVRRAGDDGWDEQAEALVAACGRM